MKYIPVIGMEIHVELKTKSKMFCDTKNGLGLEKKPNVNICPVCTAQPGSLPVPNQEAIAFVQKVGLALNCEINLNSKFDRKNYFYPDLPKGYQISQYDQPLCGKGYLEITKAPRKATPRGKQKQELKRFGITRIHLEEDTGKSMHPKGTDYTLVDFNRAGVPLMELVTEPDFTSGEEARIFCQKLRQVCRYLGVSSADMEKGHMRCEANISLMDTDEPRIAQIKKELNKKEISLEDIKSKEKNISQFFGIKVEVKNINSFKFVEKAIAYEIERQKELLESGKEVVQETRGWDSNKNITISQRVKESAHDYRYFPEPDIPPLEFKKVNIKKLKGDLPELPWQKEERFKEQYKLQDQAIEVITSDKPLADYFEGTISELREKLQSKEIENVKEEKLVKLAANYLQSEILKHLSERNEKIENIKITPENFAELIGFIVSSKINSSAAQKVLAEMYKKGGDPSQIIESKNLAQVSDTGELDKIVAKVLKDNQKSVEDYKSGKEQALQFLMGQVMKETRGKANPPVVLEILKEKIKK